MYIIPVVCNSPPIAPALLHPRQALWSRMTRHCCKWCNWAHGCNKQEACVTHLFTKFLNQCRRPRLSCFTMFPICRFPRRAFLKSPVFYCDLIRRCLKVCPGCRDARLLTCTGCLAIRACFPLAPPCEAQHALTTGGGDLES